MRKSKQNSVSDKISQIKKALVLLSILIVLFVVVFYLAPRRSIPTGWDSERVVENGGGKRYAVVFDAGSSGSRVHVYCFNERMDLVPIGNDLEIFIQKKPGLSSYSANPKEAASSLSDLLEKAESVIPAELRHRTPVRVGATAGLRALGLETSERILQAVRTFLHDKSSLKFEADWVTVIDGTQEGAFQWVTINYLLGNLGKEYSHTVGVVDLGGGSVQMAYAISEKDATNAPEILNGEDEYVKELFLKGSKYHLYVHSYLHFGLLAARAEILKADDDHGSSCILAGYHGLYKYGHSHFQVAASPEGPSYTKCRASAIKALKTDEPLCTHLKCTFGGVWNGGGGDGQQNLFVASFFFDRAAEVGFVDPNIPIAKVRPHDFAEAAKQVCETRVENAKTKYSSVEEESLPYLCMDLVYQFTLLVDGFGLDQMQDITLVKKVKYGNFLLEAAWPLGSAIEVTSSG